MLASGTRLGPYEVLAPLGAGGMGEVYRARDTRLGREVAVKVLPEHLGASPEVRARFEREARAVSALNHPNICVLHDVGRDGDTDYLVMELVEGETLAQRLERGPLSVEETLRLGRQIAEALDRAHRAGVIHRDLKPGNVMLTRGGVKLMDFGLARHTGLDGRDSSGLSRALSQSPTVAQPLTAEGTIVGTFHYMAPEQLEGGETDARSDVWALGCVLYEMATGRRAFQGRSQASLISAIMSTQPEPISTLAPMTPPAFDRLVRGCLEKDPAERVQSAHDVKLQLQWIAEGGSSGGAPAPVVARRKGRERLAWMLAGLGGMAVVLLTAALAMRTLGQRPAPSMRFDLATPTGMTTSADPNFAAVAPDGHAIVFAGQDSTGDWRLWLRNLASLEVTPLAGTENCLLPFWSPDSRTIGFFADLKLKKISVSGGSPEVLADAPDPRGGTWSRDGHTIVFAPVATGGLFRVSADGGTPQAVAVPDSAHGETALRFPEFLPDGRHFTFVSLPAGPGGFHVYVGDLGSGARRSLGTMTTAPTWAAPGHLVFGRGSRIVAQRFDDRALALRGEPAVLADGLPITQFDGGKLASASRTGILCRALSAATPMDLEWLGRDGRRTGSVRAPAALYLTISLSRDSRRLAVIRSTNGLSGDLWILDLVRSLSTRLVGDGTVGAMPPVWSHDGSWLVYNSNRRGPWNIYRQRVDGSGSEEELYTGSAQFKNITDLTADDRVLLFDQIDPVTGWDILMLPLDGSRHPVPVLRTPARERLSQLSPDGRWMSYQSDVSGRQEVYVRPFQRAGDAYQVTTEGGSFGFFSNDGRHMLIVSAQNDVQECDVVPGTSFSTTPPRLLFKGGPNTANSLYPAADLSRFITAIPEGNPQSGDLLVELNWSAALHH